ncbi:hypothetical protein K7H22_19905 [Seohaeicola saemankumensis]|uniref:hypothetical protein n=1 Tax=Seohaeicola saemankumensis TaxID=481181 RepID=UPI001E3220F8|nr:hypothetical protein [Seohaeicola saemankumensis]MCD1628246.1 hypothetical protein [Seohaeicola saemankumensis]
MAALPIPPLMKPRRKPATLMISEAQQAAMIRIATTSLNKGTKIGVKADKTERDARAAIADALTDWLDWMNSEDAAVLRSFFLQIAVLASASGRNKIIKHSMFPKDLIVEVEEHLELMKAAAEAAKAEAEAEAALKAAAGVAATEADVAAATELK